MTLLIRKYFWTINLVTIALCAFFAARAVGRLVEANVPQPKARRMAAAPGGQHQPLLGPYQRDVAAILSRNVFCSTCERLAEQANANDGQNEAPASNEPVKSSLNLTLIATLVSDQDKAWSFAAIEDGAEQATRLFAIGSKLPAGAVVTDILDRRVLLLNGARHEYLDLELGDNPSPQSSIEQPTPAPAVSATEPGMEDVSQGIRKVGEGKYEIDRNALNRVLGNTTLLARSARIVPSVSNGKPDGFKLYAIRPGSLYSLLGLTNGDTINAINGHPITTPDKALEVYTKLRSASHVSISYTRRGQAQSHEYTIR